MHCLRVRERRRVTLKMKATAGSEIFFVFASFFLKTVHAIVKRNSHARRRKSFLLVLDRISVLFPSCARNVMRNVCTYVCRCIFHCRSRPLVPRDFLKNCDGELNCEASGKERGSFKIESSSEFHFVQFFSSFRNSLSSWKIRFNSWLRNGKQLKA